MTVAAGTATAATAPKQMPAGDPAIVSGWNAIAVTTLSGDTTKQPVEDILYTAFVQAAVYDAVVGIEGGYAPYRFHARAPRGASAFASSSAPQANDHVQVLRLHADFVDAANNSAGHGGPGDVLAALFNIRTRSGAKAGTESVSLLSIPGHQQLAQSAFALNGGQIDAMVTVAETATTFTAAITGGTGIYEGVTGQILNVETAWGIDLTFRIIWPEHH